METNLQTDAWIRTDIHGSDPALQHAKKMLFKEMIGGPSWAFPSDSTSSPPYQSLQDFNVHLNPEASKRRNIAQEHILSVDSSNWETNDHSMANKKVTVPEPCNRRIESDQTTWEYFLSKYAHLLNSHPSVDPPTPFPVDHNCTNFSEILRFDIDAFTHNQCKATKREPTEESIIKYIMEHHGETSQLFISEECPKELFFTFKSVDSQYGRFSQVDPQFRKLERLKSKSS
jgi:hypothetical protein